MNLNNWYNGKTLDKTTSKSILVDTERMIENLGFEIQYSVFSNSAYEDAVCMSAYIVFDENKQVDAIEVDKIGLVVISTKTLYDNEIEPKESDQITFGGKAFSIIPSSIYYYNRNNKQTNTIENSFFVQLSIVAKRGYKKIGAIG